MSEADDQVQQAVAAYLEHAELGGRAPDFSSLPPEVRREVEQVIGTLEMTEGIALRTAAPQVPPTGGAASRTARQLAEAAASEEDRALLTALDAWLPPGSPVDVDGAHAGFALPGLPVAASWTVGTPGGRVRIWRVDRPGAGELESDPTHLESLDRVFRAFAETAAICLVCNDLSSLLLEPQDCAPGIEVPAGGLTPRRYRRPIQPVGEALAAYLRELVPAWEALPRFEGGNAAAIDVTALAERSATGSVEVQKALGARARYPKKEVLSSLGEKEARILTELAIGLYEGRRTPADVEGQLRKLAGP